MQSWHAGWGAAHPAGPRPLHPACMHAQLHNCVHRGVDAVFLAGAGLAPAESDRVCRAAIAPRRRAIRTAGLDARRMR